VGSVRKLDHLVGEIAIRRRGGDGSQPSYGETVMIDEIRADGQFNIADQIKALPPKAEAPVSKPTRARSPTGHGLGFAKAARGRILKIGRTRGVCYVNGAARGLGCAWSGLSKNMGDEMPQFEDDKAREKWAKRNAEHLVDGILGASERSGWPWHPTPDQIVLLREIARRAIWHMPNSRDEVRELARYFDIEKIRQPHSGDDPSSS
jgi:hypothetical protein